MEEDKAENNKAGTGRKKIALAVFAVIVLIGAVALHFYLGYKAGHITTDDAFVDGHIHTVASKISGTVKEVFVSDNQMVKKGDLLVEIDPVDYAVRVEESGAAFSAEKGKIAEVDAKIDASKKQLLELQARADAAKSILELQKANLEQAEKDMKRAEVLYKDEAYSEERYEKTGTAYKVAFAQMKAASEGLRNTLLSVETQRSIIKQAEASKTTQLSTIKQKEATLEIAQLNSGYTKIYAPSAGYITKKSIEPGNQIQPGQPLMAVVPLDDVYVTANYKETELKKVRPGQKVEISVDGYPGKTFHGTLESIASGTGSVFSLFPPENATGQYVKVVQRIPVKIVFDKNSDPGHLLRIGMSVEPTVIIK